MEDLEQRVALLKNAIVVADPRRPPDWRFEREVDHLVDAFYDDIGTIVRLPLKSLFDLFLIKVVYVGRGARDHAVLDYLSDMLNRFLLTRELMGSSQLARFDLLLSILDEMNERRRFQNLFEASRQMGDNALFLTGVFPESRPRRRRWGQPRPPRIDKAHFIEAGSRYYRVAAEEELAAVVGQRDVLSRLAASFGFYVDALSEMSRRYILGLDMEVVANKMLDAFNRYRETGAQEHLENARKYAALLKVDRSFTGLHRPRARIIDLSRLD